MFKLPNVLLLKAEPLKRLLITMKMVFRAKPKYVVALLLVTLLQGLGPAASLWLGKLIIDCIVQGMGSLQGTLGTLFGLLTILLVINILLSAISNIGLVIQTLLGDIITNNISIGVMEKSASLDLYHYEDPKFYDMLTRARRESSSRPLTILSQFYDLLRNMVAMASFVVVIARLNWLAIIILGATSIPQALFQRKYAKMGYSLYFRQTQDSRKMLYLSELLTSIFYFKEVKLFGLSGHFLGKYKHLYGDIFAANKKLVINKNLGIFMFSLLSSLVNICFFAYAAYMTLNHSISLGELILYTGAFSQCQGRFTGIVNNVALLYENSLFINNLFDFYALTPQIKAPSIYCAPPSRIQKGVTFRNVSFGYPGTGKTVLKDLSFHIGPEESFAIVGENGAGKTTIVKLLSRLYDPDSGSILLDGIDVRQFNPNEYRGLIGVIFQDFCKYQLTARENIALSSINEIDNIGRIKRAASTSGADQIIERMPYGYDTVLGRYFDSGIELSTGEWQRIAIARGFMRDSQILILDEPTASVDIKTEYEIFASLERLLDKRICVLISHRFSTVKMAKQILVLENGALAEQGTHVELMRQGGKYASMFNLQAEKYII